MSVHLMNRIGTSKNVLYNFFFIFHGRTFFFRALYICVKIWAYISSTIYCWTKKKYYAPRTAKLSTTWLLPFVRN